MEGFGFQVEVKRTDRKKSASIALVGTLVKISVPKDLPDSLIRDLIIKRSSWIKKKLREQSLRPTFKPKKYVNGETVHYLGGDYCLQVVAGDQASIQIVDRYLVVTVLHCEKDEAPRVRLLLEGWYQGQAFLKLKERTESFTKIIGVTPKSVKVKNYKSRWGSCSISGEITYNWRIVLAPHRVIDYVVVHELCHLLEHNHSARYWRHVEQYAPDWKICRKWLKHHQQMLGIGN